MSTLVQRPPTKTYWCHIVLGWFLGGKYWPFQHIPALYYTHTSSHTFSAPYLSTRSVRDSLIGHLFIIDPTKSSKQPFVSSPLSFIHNRSPAPTCTASLLPHLQLLWSADSYFFPQKCSCFKSPPAPPHTLFVCFSFLPLSFTVCPPPPPSFLLIFTIG